MSKPTILFVPGLATTGMFHAASLRMKFFFWRRGYDFKVVTHGMGDTHEEVSREITNMKFKATKPIHLVGHSQGGLACRYNAHIDRLTTQIQTLTTISCPHRGSPVADKYVDQSEPLPKDASSWARSVRQLTSKSMTEFNDNTPDNPNVRYYSIGFTGDSMVQVESAKWGTYLGTLKGSHLQQTSPFGNLWKQTFEVVAGNLKEALKDE